MNKNKASFRHGLPYGWWKNTDVWAATISAISLIGVALMMWLVLAAWFLDWKPFW